MKTLLKSFFALLHNPQRPVARVLLGGAAGGALGMMAGTMLGEITADWWRIIVPCVALGAGAAFIAVFVLLGIKTEDVHRCCGVALLAGFFWQPVFAAGKDYLSNTGERKAEQRAAKGNEELEEVLTQLVKTPSNAVLVAQAGVLAQSLTRETADLRRNSLKSRAQGTVAQTIDVLAIKAEQKQPAAANALFNVAETAIRTGNRAVAEKARLQVERVPVTANSELQVRKLEIMQAPVVPR